MIHEREGNFIFKGVMFFLILSGESNNGKEDSFMPNFINSYLFSNG